jgi:hypothetical protein
MNGGCRTNINSGTSTKAVLNNEKLYLVDIMIGKSSKKSKKVKKQGVYYYRHYEILIYIYNRKMLTFLLFYFLDCSK